jgi:hypothetical protein
VVGTWSGISPAGKRTPLSGNTSRYGESFNTSRKHWSAVSKACMESTPDTGLRVGSGRMPSIRTGHCHSPELTCRGKPSETMIRLLGSSASMSLQLAMTRPMRALDVVRDFFTFAGMYKSLSHFGTIPMRKRFTIWRLLMRGEARAPVREISDRSFSP